jgi:predicted phage tail protein
MRTVFLHGHLGERFGESHRLEVESTAEAVRALKCNFPDFYGSLKEGSYQIIRGTRYGGEQLDAELLTFGLGNANLHIVPVIEGAGDDAKAIITAVIGVVLIAASIYTAGTSGAAGASLMGSMGTTTFLGVSMTQYAMFGAMLALSGVAQMISSTPKVGNYDDREEKRSSWLFNGAVNRIEQGGALPVIYGGPIRVGSVLVSAGIDAVAIDADSGIPSNLILVVEVSGEGNGFITPAIGTFTYRKDTRPVFTFQANDEDQLYDGTYIDNWIVDVKIDGDSMGAITSFDTSIWNLGSRHTIHVKFSSNYPPPPDDGTGGH